MAGRLPPPPAGYSQSYEVQRNKNIDELRDAAYKGDRDLVLRPGVAMVMHSPDGSAWRVTVTNAGALQVDPA